MEISSIFAKRTNSEMSNKYLGYRVALLLHETVDIVDISFFFFVVVIYKFHFPIFQSEGQYNHIVTVKEQHPLLFKRNILNSEAPGTVWALLWDVTGLGSRVLPGVCVTGSLISEAPRTVRAGVRALACVTSLVT